MYVTHEITYFNDDLTPEYFCDTCNTYFDRDGIRVWSSHHGVRRAHLAVRPRNFPDSPTLRPKT